MRTKPSLRIIEPEDSNVVPLPREIYADDALLTEAALLSIPLSLDEAVAIWRRARAALTYLAYTELDEVKRNRIVAIIEERERSMQAILDRANWKGN